MSKDLEARLLASIPSIGHFQALEELGVTEASFEFYGPMYRYIEQITNEHGYLPRLLDLKATFNVPDHVRRKPEEYDWLLHEFVNITMIQRIQDTMDNNIERYSETPTELLPSLIKDLTGLSLPDQRAASVSDGTALKRIDGYEEKISEEMIVGIPTGIRYFDSDYRIGWMPGELVGILGRLFVGKSWMLMYHGLMAWRSGRRVLFISPEMPEEEAEIRLDAMLWGMNDVPVDINDLFRGYKPSAEQKAISEQMSKRGDWITISSAEGRSFSLGEIPRYIKQFSPDIVLIDGLLLVDSGSRGKPWEQMKEISYGLKNIAVGSNTVILVAHQANRGASDYSKPPELHEVYMGDSFAQAADRVIVLSIPKKPDNTLRITVQKFRKGRPMRKGTDFEFLPGNGIIKERSIKEQLKVVPETVPDEDLLPIP